MRLRHWSLPVLLVVACGRAYKESQTFASWNRVANWLSRMDALRQAGMNVCISAVACGPK